MDVGLDDAVGGGETDGPRVCRREAGAGGDAEDLLRDLPEHHQLVVFAEPFDADAVYLGGPSAQVGGGPVTGSLGEPEAVLGRGLQGSAADRGDRVPQQSFDRVGR
ncbi:hypothetical protein ABZV31_26895 [Streptomyces sp. NPDC005202]|uniref:hypothetical protein n=1 Tax=Streptomyces sp. NPDC005202 TaxID=3157021 RepID=UPI0033B06FFD